MVFTNAVNGIKKMSRRESAHHIRRKCITFIKLFHVCKNDLTDYFSRIWEIIFFFFFLASSRSFAIFCSHFPVPCASELSVVLNVTFSLLLCIWIIQTFTASSSWSLLLDAQCSLDQSSKNDFFCLDHTRVCIENLNKKKYVKLNELFFSLLIAFLDRLFNIALKR